MSCGSVWQVDQKQAIHVLAVFIEDHEVCEASVGCIHHNLLQREALQNSIKAWHKRIMRNS